MLLLKRRMLIYIVLIVSGSLRRRMGRPPVCCIYICNNVCNCSKNEDTFLSRQSIQLNCVSFLARHSRAQLACNSSQTNCLVSVFPLSLFRVSLFPQLYNCTAGSCLCYFVQSQTLSHRLEATRNIRLLLERVHIVHKFDTYIIVWISELCLVHHCKYL